MPSCDEGFEEAFDKGMEAYDEAFEETRHSGKSPLRLFREKCPYEPNKRKWNFLKGWSKGRAVRTDKKILYTGPCGDDVRAAIITREVTGKGGTVFLYLKENKRKRKGIRKNSIAYEEV